MAKNNKFSLLNTDNDEDDNNDTVTSTVSKPIKREKTLIEEEEEINKMLQSTTSKRYRKKAKQVVETFDEPRDFGQAGLQLSKPSPIVTDENIKTVQQNKAHVIETEEPDKYERQEKRVVRDDKLLENKEIYDENHNYGDIGDDKKLNSYWTVWVHRTTCTDWKITGYQRVYVINSLGSFWRFFNNFQMLNTYNNNIFIMREEIAPIWEDVNNKFGGICSLKIDSTQRGLKTDISTEIFTLMSLLIMNETLVSNNKNINGISFGVKKRSTLIKVWTKTYDDNKDFVKELPVPLINKFNVEMQKHCRNVLNNDGKISIQYKQIKPEYEL